MKVDNSMIDRAAVVGGPGPQAPVRGAGAKPLHVPSRTTSARAMTTFVPIEVGQFVLAFEDHCFYPDQNLVENLERLQHRGAGWDHIRVEGIFQVRLVLRVMPKTYQDSQGRRHYRECVIAAAASEGELIALRDKLFAIGHAADDSIEAEQARLIAAFEKAERAAALAKIHDALPHIFARSA